MTAVADLAHRAAALGQGRGRVLLGIAGSPGSGKTTLATALVDELRRSAPQRNGAEWVAYVPMDGFHLADRELDRLGRRRRKGAPDTFDAAGYVALLARLRADPDETVYAPAFERDLEQPIAGSIPVPPEVRMVVTEGNYLLLDTGHWARVRPLLDEAWFVEADEDERRSRLVARHQQFGKELLQATAWVDQVDQPNAELVEASRTRADLLVGG